MKSITKLKDEARKHEQKEEWEKAIKVYLQVLEAGDDGEAGEVELPLFNRVGDLYVRLNRSGDAVRYYEQAADRYADAGLFNNAIALCNKALRYMPSHVELLRKLGQFSASQGFITDARRYFLEFAEKKFASGETEAALSALEDFANVADDAEVRELLGRKLHAHGKPAEAVEELKKAYEMRVAAGEGEAAEALRGEILRMDATAFEHGGPAAPARSHPMHHHERPADLPGLADITVSTPAAAPPAPEPEPELGDFAIEMPGLDAAPGAAAPEPADAGLLEGFESTSFEGFEEAEADAGLLAGLEAAAEFEAPAELPTLDPGEIGLDRPSFEPPVDEALPALDLTGFEESTGPLEDAFELPTLDEDEETEAEEGGFALPLLGDEEEDEAEAEPLPTLDFGELPEAAEPLPTLDEELAEPALDFDAGLSDISLGSPGEPPAPDEATESAELPMLAEEPETETADAFPPFPGVDEEPGAETEAPFEEPAFEAEASIEGAFEVEAPEPEAEAPEAEAEVPELEAEAPEAEAEVPEPEAEAPEAEAEAPEAEAPAAGAPPAAPEDTAERPGWDPSELGPPPVPVPPPPAPPATKKPAPAGEFINLGSLLAEDEEEEKDTRFVVQEKAPTGDEDRDFAELLSQFKQKVAEHVSAEDAAAHYDLGLAFKEMGLIDEAISEFQIALRAGEIRMKVYEELGQCFLQKEQYNIAEKVLRKAMESPYKDEIELLGVYYHLGRAYEGLGRRDQARDAYERVLGLDINFGDVSQRLARL